MTTRHAMRTRGAQQLVGQRQFRANALTCVKTMVDAYERAREREASERALELPELTEDF